MSELNKKTKNLYRLLVLSIYVWTEAINNAKHA